MACYEAGRDLACQRWQTASCGYGGIGGVWAGAISRLSKKIATYQGKVAYYADKIAAGKKCGTFPFRAAAKCDERLAKYQGLLEQALAEQAAQEQAAASVTSGMAPSPIPVSLPVADTSEMAPTSESASGGSGTVVGVFAAIALVGGVAFFLLRKRKKARR